ncbi:MAG: YceH family protein [Phycisphaerales bacterium]|jgi:uncharacterized protein YceH (UPF0502 family)
MSSPLLPDECRALGVLIEKAQTTPAQYPLTLNGVVVGCSQKNNREPVVEFDEERALVALDGLRAKSLVREVSLEGSRVPKYRHVARETLAVDTPQLVVIAELLLRGPQTVGELRGRASRMHPLDSMEVVEHVLDALSRRESPLVREIPPLPGSRSPRWMQLLCPALHPLGSATASWSRDATSAARGDAPGPADVARGEARDRGAFDQGAFEARLDRLERELATIKATLRELGADMGGA